MRSVVVEADEVARTRDREVIAIKYRRAAVVTEFPPNRVSAIA